MKKVFIIPLLVLLQACAFNASIGARPSSNTSEQTGPANPAVIELYAKGNYLLGMGDYPGAEEAFKTALTMEPNSPAIHRKLAELYLEQNKLNDAFDHAQVAFKATPDDYSLLFLLARIEASRSNFEESRKYLLKMRSVRPEDDDAAMLLWRVDANLQRFDEAAAVLNDLIKNYPEIPELRLFLGLVYEAAGKMPEAKKALEGALAISPNTPSLLLKMGDIENALGNKDRAKEYYRRVLDLNPADAEAKQKLMALGGANSPDAPEPGSIEELGLQNGIQLLDKEKFKEAAVEFEKLRAAHPNNSLIALYLGIAYESDERYAEALKVYESIPQESALYIEAAIRRAAILSDTGRKQEAFELLQKTSAIDPHRGDVRLFLAKICLDTERYDQAVGILEELNKSIPDNLEVFFLLGVAYGEAGRKADALKVMKKVLEANPDSAEALNYVGYSYAEDGVRLDEAELMILKAMKLRPGSAAISDSLGWVYYQRGNYPKAIAILEAAFGIDSKEPVIAEHLGDAYAKVGRKDDAIKMYKTALGLNPPSARVKIIRGKIEALGGSL